MKLSLAISALLALVLESARAEPTPDAASVATQIGHAVVFEDVVKAVSRSRSREGYYLSFGAAYPEQVLSVWVPKDVYHRLPGAYELHERAVRISGRIESSPTGPMLNLESPEQFALVALDTAVLSQLRLDGKIDRQHFAAAVLQDFEREDFAKLEQLSTELHQSRERFSDGTWILDAFFLAFDLPADVSSERYDWMSQAVDRWTGRYPNSVSAALVKAGLQVDRAWKGRGTGWVRTITPEGREDFRRELALARQLLESKAWAKASPRYFVLMQSVALGQAWPKQEYFRLFEEGVGRERDYYALYFSAAYYLLPRWYGEKGDWERFAEGERKKRGGPEGDALYTRIAWSIAPVYDRTFFKETAASWDTMAAGFDVLLRKYPDSAYLQNACTHFAWRAGDRTRLRAGLEQIKAAPDMSVWVNLENVQLAEKFARGELRAK